MHCEVGQHLAVDLDGSLLQAVGELAVGQASSRAAALIRAIHNWRNTRFLVAAVTVGILPSLHYRLFGDTEDVTAATTETLGRGENFLVTGAGRYTTFDAGMYVLLVRQLLQASARQHLCDRGPCWSHAHSLHHAGGACSWWSSWSRCDA